MMYSLPEKPAPEGDRTVWLVWAVSTLEPQFVQNLSLVTMGFLHDGHCIRGRFARTHAPFKEFTAREQYSPARSVGAVRAYISSFHDILQDTAMVERTRTRPKALVSWSSGKDSAMALHRILDSNEFEIIAILTTVSDTFQRVSMHGVREELLVEQANSIGLALERVRIPYPCPNEIYELKMSNLLQDYKSRGVSHVVFGDLFLEDIRKYREDKLRQIGLTPIFPLWNKNTTELARSIIRAGFKAIITCVDPKKLDPKFAGRHFDDMFLSEIPANVDPCGENGEFHTFVFDGPIFRNRIDVNVGERVVRDGFQFVDLLPGK